MKNDLRVLALIPARGGSVGIPGKNTALLAGRPLIAYTIDAARGSRYPLRIVLSTDVDDIAGIGRTLGAEVPFRRPASLATSEAPALPVIRHAVQTLEKEEGWSPDIVLYLQPTSPLRTSAHIDAALDRLVAEEADTVVSVTPVPHRFHPLSVMDLREDGTLVSYLPEGADVRRRQDKSRVYARNGPAVLAGWRRTFLEEGVLYGSRTLPLLMAPEDSIDIDTPKDLEAAEEMLRRKAGNKATS